jgi:hypothetical protein
MPPTDGRAGDSRRDPVALMVVAAVLLLARVGVTVWEQQNAPADSGQPGLGAPIRPGP